jgi:hypothetical protein
MGLVLQSVCCALAILVINSCGYDFCVLGAGECNPSSVQIETKKIMEVSFSPSEIFSNFINGPTFTDLVLTGGVGRFTLSLPDDETVAKLINPDNNSEVLSVTTNSRTVRVKANIGLAKAKDIVVTVKDSDSPITTKKIVITVKP